MIYFLKGIIEEIGDNFIAMDVNGVGYQAFASSRTLANLAEGEVTKIYIYSHVREVEFTLYGFIDAAERQLFVTLTSVSGVGPKVGLAIMAALSDEEIISAIVSQDGKMLTRANGVGPKLGARIVLELKGKINNLPASTGGIVTASAPAGSVGNDVLSALENLGYKPQHARQAVANANEILGDEASFDNLFKASLAELR